jgi:hypothetical protein
MSLFVAFVHLNKTQIILIFLQKSNNLCFIDSLKYIISKKINFILYNGNREKFRRVGVDKKYNL